MSYQCYSVNNIAKNIRNKNLGLVCSDFCDYYDLILFDFITEDLADLDCSATSYSDADDAVYYLDDNDLPDLDNLNALNNESASTSTIDCSGYDDPEITNASELDIVTCSNNILIEFINQDGVVVNNPNNSEDMRPSYYEFTFTGSYTLTLPTKTLINVIVFYPTATSTIKVGTSSGADDIIFEESITTVPANYPYTINRHFAASTPIYFSSTASTKVIVYVE